MGISVKAALAYGVKLDDLDAELRWSDFDGIEDWWFSEIHPFKPSFEVFDLDGHWLLHITDAQKDIYYDELDKHEKENPCPIELVEVGHYENCSYILALTDTQVSTNYFSCSQVNLQKLDGIAIFNRQKFVDFCKEYLKVDVDPKWYLISHMS